MTETPWLFVSVGFAALVLLVGHWFPWPSKLPRLGAYSIGVGAILGGFTIWRGVVGDWETVAGLVSIVGGSALAVFGGYGIDWLVGKIKKANKAERTHERERTK